MPTPATAGCSTCSARCAATRPPESRRSRSRTRRRPRNAATRRAGGSCRPRTWSSRSRSRWRRGATKRQSIIARTDARTALGLDEALRRAKLYEKAGADIMFVESPESEAELERDRQGSEQAAARQHGGVRQDATLGGRQAQEVGLRSGDLSRSRLQRRGRSDAPGLGHLKDNGTSNGVTVPQYRDMHELMGFAGVWDFEKKWAQ